MITEDYVSFETAKLLKEKGFDCGCRSLYYENKKFDVSLGLYSNSKLEKHDIKGMISAPTHQMALKWLREVREIHIDVFIGSDESYDADGVVADEWHFWTYYITNTSGDMIYDAYNEVDVIEYQSHEEAVEAALLYVLKNLI